MQRLYLYLASRSKKGIKLITFLNNESTVSLTSISNTGDLQIPMVWQKEVQKTINDNIMLYEPLMETAPSFNELRKRLKHRGFTNLPMGASQIINLLKFDKPPVANISSKNVKNVMLQKGKR